MNYKTEQEKQDKEFEERFCYKSIAKQLIVTYDLCKNPVKLREYLKSYIFSRDQALLEAFKKDVGEMIGENIPLMKEEDSIQFTAGQNLEKAKFRSLLEGYNLNKYER